VWTVQRAGPGPGPFFRLCEACARRCRVCTGVTLQPWSAESGEISGAAGVSQAGVRLSLPSPSSCLPRLIPPPQSRKIGREITGMTSRKVRCKVNYEPDVDHLRPEKHQHRRLPRQPRAGAPAQVTTACGAGKWVKIGRILVGRNLKTGLVLVKYGQQSSNRSSGVCSNWEQTAAKQSKAGVKCCEAGVEGVCAWRKAVWKVDVRQRPRPCGQHG